MTERPRICDYGDSSYRRDFWEGQGRDYEDAVERRLLRRLLPSGGRRLLEIGAGFGRLTGEYHRYQQIVLLDYSLEQLQYARERFGDAGFLYIAADAYRMPFRAGAFDAATMIRVIHHFENVPAVLQQIRAVLASGGRFVLEFANKRHLKSMIRHLFGRNAWNPYTLEPVEFVELNYDFHPEYMLQQVTNGGFAVRRTVPVSWFRLGLLKRSLPTGLLASLDGLLQRCPLSVSPSVFLDLQRQGGAALCAPHSTDPLDILSCPDSGRPLRRDGACLISESGLRWRIQAGVYDFRKPVN